MIRAVTFFVLTIALSAAMSCAVLADQFVGGSSAFAIFIAWTSDGSGHLQGQVQTVSLAGPKVDRTSASFTGTRSGSEVSLVFPLLSNYSGQTWTGNFGFRSLTLQLSNNAELQLSAGSFAEFRDRVSSVEQQASVAAAAAAAVDAHEQRIADALRALNEVNGQWNSAKRRLVDALTQLKEMFPIAAPDPSDSRTLQAKYATAVSRMETSWAHEQQVADVQNLTCYQKGQVEYGAGQVSYAHGQLQYQDSEFEAFDRTATGDLVVARSAIDAMDQIYPPFKARYREYRQLVPSTPEAQLTQAAIIRMKHELLPLLDHFGARLSSVRRVARDADRNGDDIDAKANEFPKSLSCSG